MRAERKLVISYKLSKKAYEAGLKAFKGKRKAFEKSILAKLGVAKSYSLSNGQPSRKQEGKINFIVY